MTVSSDIEVPVPIYRVCHCSGPIRIDGRLDEFDWVIAERITFMKFEHQPEDSKPLREITEVRALWNEQYLYLAFSVQDREIWASIRKRGARLFPEECVEIFVDPDGDGLQYVEAQINSVNNIRDLLVDSGVKNPTYSQYDTMARWHLRNMQKAVRVYRDNAGGDIGWTLEMAVPWSALAFSRRKWPPAVGDTLRINFCRFERSRTGHLPLELSGWSNVGRNFHQPLRFGTFVFSSSRGSTED